MRLSARKELHWAILLTTAEYAILEAYLKKTKQALSEIALLGFSEILNSDELISKKRTSELRAREVQIRITPALYKVVSEKAKSLGVRNSDLLYESLRRKVDF